MSSCMLAALTLSMLPCADLSQCALQFWVLVQDYKEIILGFFSLTLYNHSWTWKDVLPAASDTFLVIRAYPAQLLCHWNLYLLCLKRFPTKMLQHLNSTCQTHREIQISFFIFSDSSTAKKDDYWLPKAPSADCNRPSMPILLLLFSAKYLL